MIIGSRTYNAIYIEDNSSNARLMQEIMSKRHDVHLTIAVDAESGLDRMELYKPDFVLMDIDLPGISGFEALARLKSRLDTREIPVVAVTANAMPSDVRAGLRAGFFDYLTKPFTISELFRLVDQLQDFIESRHHGVDRADHGRVNQAGS